MRTVLKYVLYVVIAVLLGALSAYGKLDYVASLQSSIVQLLASLLAIYSTISSILVMRLIHYKSAIDKNAKLSPIIKSMKWNVIIESILILVVLLVIIVSQVLLNVDHWCLLFACLRNSVIVFALLYFVVVVYDSSMGLYDLLEFESKIEE